MTHTPTPWAVGPYGGVYMLNDDGIHGPLIVSGETRNGTLPNKEENEAFIVAAVNAYDKQRALIETLTAALVEIVGCFDAADIEGFQERINEVSFCHVGSWSDIVIRRILPAADVARAAAKEAFK